MPFIYVDRRKAGKGKSSPNRQKLLRRVRSFIKSSNPNNIGSVASGGVSGNGSKSFSPVKVTSDALEEPSFLYARDGDHTMIIIGNKQYDRGDEIEIPEDSQGKGSKAGQGGSSEDDFIVNVAKDEFFDLFFEDCELPNLTNEKYTEKLDNKFQHAGFSTTGNPAQLSIIRTYKQSLGRRRALSGPYREELQRLEDEQEELMLQLAEHKSNGTGCDDGVDDSIQKRLNEIQERIVVLHRKLAALEGFDKVDLRYRKHEAKPLKTVDAVLVMIMDISGSMDEEKKRIARRWFALLYAFIKRRYSNTELLFIAHTDEAFEMNEDDFFSTRVSGGTCVSPALKMANKLIKERYDPNQTNIYISHASDGDNWDSDNALVVDEMISEGHLLNKIQYFSYAEVGKQYSNTWFSMGSGNQTRRATNLWEAYEKIREKQSSKMSLVVIENPDSCYEIFKKVFRKP
jgi:hypothetical protein